MKNKMAASHGSGPQSPPSIGRPVDRVFEDAQLTGEIILHGRKLRDFPKICNKYDLSDTVHVDVSRNRLADVPAEVCSYQYVERLNCYHNVIRSIPDAISQNQALTHLNLSRNQLTVLPPALCMLTSLEVLFVSNNKLVSLPEEIGQLENLMDLDVSCNEISHLPLQIGDLSSLRSLNLRRNFLVELPVEISRLHLYKLDFSSNRIEKIPTVFRKMETLQLLIQANNPLLSPPAYICTKGKQHIMKYLQIEAMKEDRKRGIIASNDFDLKRITRKSLPPQSSEELRGILGGPDKWKRHTVLSNDSGYSTGDGGEKNGWHSGEIYHPTSNLEANNHSNNNGSGRAWTNPDGSNPNTTASTYQPHPNHHHQPHYPASYIKPLQHYNSPTNFGSSSSFPQQQQDHYYPQDQQGQPRYRNSVQPSANNSTVTPMAANQITQTITKASTNMAAPNQYPASSISQPQQDHSHHHSMKDGKNCIASNSSSSGNYRSSMSMPPPSQLVSSSSSRRHSSNSSSSTLSPGPSDLPPYPHSPSPSPSTGSSSSTNNMVPRPDSLPTGNKLSQSTHSYSSYPQNNSNSYQPPLPTSSQSNNSNTKYHNQPHSNASNQTYLSPQLMPYPTANNLAERELYSPTTSPTTPTANSPGYHPPQQQTHNHLQKQPHQYYHERQSNSSPLPPPPPLQTSASSLNPVHVRQWSNSSNISEQSLPLPPPPSSLLPPPPPSSLPPASPSPSLSSLRSNSPTSRHQQQPYDYNNDHNHHQHEHQYPYRQTSRPPSAQSNPSSYKTQNIPSSPSYYNSNPGQHYHENNSHLPPPIPPHTYTHTNKYNNEAPTIHQTSQNFGYIDDEDTGDNNSSIGDGVGTFDSSPLRIMTGSMEDEFTRELKRQKADYERKKKEAEEIRSKQQQLDQEEREKEECRRAAIKLQEEQKKQEELRRQQEEYRIAEEMRRQEEEEARKREEEVRKLQETVRLREAEEAMEKQRQAEELQAAREAEEARKSKLSSNYYNQNSYHNSNNRSTGRTSYNHPSQPPPNPPSSSSHHKPSTPSSSHYAQSATNNNNHTAPGSSTNNVTQRSLPPKPPSSLPVHGVGTNSLIPVSQRESPSSHHSNDNNKEYIMSENEYRNALSTQSFKEQNRRLANNTNSTQYRRAASDGLKKSTPSPASSQVETLNHINKNGMSSSSDNNLHTSSSSNNSRLSSSTSTTPSVSPSPSPSSSISYLARPTSNNSHTNNSSTSNSPHSSTSHLAKPTSSSSTSSPSTHHHSNLAKPSSSTSNLSKAAPNKTSAMPRASPSNTAANGQSQVVRRTKLAGDRSNTSSPTTARSTRTAQGPSGLRPTGVPNSLTPTGGSSNLRRSSNSSTTDDERSNNNNKSNSITPTSLAPSRLKSSRLEEPKQRGVSGSNTGVRKLATPDNDNKRINTKPPTSTYGSNRTRTTATRNSDDGPNMRNKEDYHREEAEQMDRLRQTVEARLKVTLPDNLPEALRDGVVLCHLANQIRPRAVGSIHVPSPAVPKLTLAKCRRNVDNFLEACRKIGIGQEQICNAQDVLEERGVGRVAITVAALVAIGTNPKQSAV